MNVKYRRAVLGIALALGLLSVAPAGVMAGGQPSCGDTLFTNTTLTANLNCSGYFGDALEMGAHGVDLNLNGKTITGPAGDEGYDGVDTNGFNRTTIRNGTIRDYSTGVEVDGSNRTTVRYLKIDGEDANNANGIDNSNGVKNVFHHLTVTDVSTGVYTEHSAETVLRDSNVTAGDYGYYAYETTKNSVSNNVLTAGDYGVYEYRSHRNTYTGNRSNGGDFGFYFNCEGFGKVNVNANTANNNGEGGIILNQCYVVDHPLDGYTGSRVVNNTANGNSYGMASYESYNELWRGNTANDNDIEGFYFGSPSGHRIVENKALRNQDGFYIEDNYSYYDVATISNNIARNNDNFGFYANSAADSRDNVATGNGTNCFNVDC